MKTPIPPSHPRAESLCTREKMIKQYEKGIVARSGLIAHGRGEAFDYILGEKTTKPSAKAIAAASSMLLMAKAPVISVNGNAAALASENIVKLSRIIGTKIEVNLFYRSIQRERKIKTLLENVGAEKVYGVGKDASATIPELDSERRKVDPRAILLADVVLVPLEDGDRTEALLKMGKKVIAIDLNPLSRTAQQASVTIVDNITRAMPRLVEASVRLKTQGAKKWKNIITHFDNGRNLNDSIKLINERLVNLARQGNHLTLEGGEKLEL